MLTYLKVSDFALIENIEVEFHSGLNVLTGETGAGKTVLIGAIGLLLGDRADALLVRHGADAAAFSAVFDVSALPSVTRELERSGYLEDGEGELLLGRTVTKQGKSRCTVNGRLCPVSVLSEIGDLLVEVHGQNTHQSLLKAATHLGYLDRFAGAPHLETLARYREHYARLRALVAEKLEVRGEGRDLGREAELLSHEIESIDASELRPGEVEELEAEAKRMRHAKELWELGTGVEEVLAGGERSSFNVRELLARAAGGLRKMASHDETLAETAKRLESLAYETEDVAAELARYRESLDTEPARLEELESRLSLLRDMCRKYGGTLEDVLEYRPKAAAKLAAIEEMDRRSSIIDSEIEVERSEVEKLAGELAAARKGAAGSLEKAVAGELNQLELAGARFKVGMSEREPGESGRETGHCGPFGSTEVEFLFTSEPTGPVLPLRRIASGGEMSRVMLALKIVLAGADRLPVLVFDEVDAGIGGETAGKVGEKLFQLTRYHQVFCVTHIPQIATFADWQYLVFKGKGAHGARTGIELLRDESRVEEMCRMLGDSSGRKVTKEHARDILERAKKAKPRLVPG